MHRILLTAALGLGLAAGAQAATSATVVIQAGPQPAIVAPMMVQPPPPPPRYETMPRARHGMVWSQGHWEWRHRAYVWVPGQWVRVRRGHAWQQPQWVQRGPQWVFIAGRWGDDRPRHDRGRRGHHDRDGR